jgi:hypothetical protein
VIPNVTRGGRARGLLRYLTAPKEQAVDAEQRLEPRELHTHPHLVAGSGGLVEEWGGYDLSPRYNPSAADEIAAWLDEPRVRSGARVSVPRRDQQGGVLVDERGGAVRKDAHVWHCSLSLHPEEPERSDEQWAAIASEFVAEMGFGNCRWIALRHGLSPAGNDHVHVVVQLVDNDGKPASVHNDRPRAQECCRALEERHALRAVEGREAKRGARATSYRQRYRAEREYERAVKDGQPSPASREPDREVLERAVRLSAAASASEGEFVRRLRAEGLIVRPRFAAGREDQVVGYSVALTPAEGREVVPHAGGTLAKDLTLPRLRSDGGWSANEPDAIEEWQRAFHGLAPGPPPAPVTEPPVVEAIAELRAVRENAGDNYAALARVGAATFYGWARLDPEHAGVLERCAIELTRSAQNRAAASRPAGYRAPALPLMAAALLNPSNKTLWRLALLGEMIALARAVAAAHTAAGELQRAERLLAEVRAQLDPLRTGFEDAHAAVDPEYAHTLQSHRAAREAQRLARIATGGAPPRPGRSTTPAAAAPRPPVRLAPRSQKPGRGR